MQLSLKLKNRLAGGSPAGGSRVSGP